MHAEIPNPLSFRRDSKRSAFSYLGIKSALLRVAAKRGIQHFGLPHATRQQVPPITLQPRFCAGRVNAPYLVNGDIQWASELPNRAGINTRRIRRLITIRGALAGKPRRLRRRPSAPRIALLCCAGRRAGSRWDSFNMTHSIPPLRSAAAGLHKRLAEKPICVVPRPGRARRCAFQQRPPVLSAGIPARRSGLESLRITRFGRFRRAGLWRRSILPARSAGRSSSASTKTNLNSYATAIGILR